MNGRDLREIAVKLYGERGWQKQLAAALGRDVSSIRRFMESDTVPQVVELAIKGLQGDEEDRKLLELARGVMRNACYAEKWDSNDRQRMERIVNKIEKRLGYELTGPRAAKEE